MRKSRYRIVLLSCLALFISIFGNHAAGEPDGGNGIVIRRIDFENQYVIIQPGKDPMKIIHIGETYRGIGKLVLIDDNRAVFQKGSGESEEKIIFQLVNGNQKMQKLKKLDRGIRQYQLPRYGKSEK